MRREFAEVGGLLAYGPSWADNHRRTATYVDKILKGAKPADLPVEQPMKFELVINLKTAQVLGITMPLSLLILADEGDQVAARAGARRGLVNEGTGLKEEYPSAAHRHSQPNQAVERTRWHETGLFPCGCR